MDIDELDELVDFEEDAMMTDAVEDANGEIDMDPVDDVNLDGDEEMSEAAEPGPEGVTVSVAMTPTPFGIPEGMQEEVTMSTVEVAPVVTDWPPAPTSIPAVPSRLPEASLVPSLLQHEEGKIIRSEVNSVAAEPPASPSKTLLSVNALASRPASPPVAAGPPIQEPASADKALIDVVPDVVDAAVDETKDKATEAISGIPADVETGTVAAESGISQGFSEGKPAETFSTDGPRKEGNEAPVAKTEVSVESSSTDALTKEAVQEHDQTLENGHEHSQPNVEDELEGEERDVDHDEHDHHTGDYNEPTGEHDYPPIVIEIVPGVVRPLFFPLAKELWPEIERPHAPEGDEKSDPERPLLPGLAAELFKAPLRDLFVALRAVLGEDWDESRGTEMILHEKALGLKIGEDNKYTETLTLHDLVDLYIRCNCAEPMCLYVEYETVRFIAKYNAIKDVLDHNAAPPDVDSSADGEEEDHEAEIDGSHEHAGQEEQGEHEEHDAEHEEYDGHEDGDYDEHGDDEIEGEGHDDEEGGEHEEAHHDQEQDEPVQVDSKPSPRAGEVPQQENTSSDPASKAGETASEAAQELLQIGAESDEAGERIIIAASENVYDEHDELDEAENYDGASDADGDTFGIDAAAREVESKTALAAVTTSLVDTTAVAESDSSHVKAGSLSPENNKLKRGPEDEADLDSERSVKRVFSGDDIEA